jgi:hypothetical protein
MCQPGNGGLSEDRNRSLERYRVLILEDEYFLANDLEMALRARGADVIGPIAERSEAMTAVSHYEFDGRP